MPNFSERLKQHDQLANELYNQAKMLWNLCLKHRIISAQNGGKSSFAHFKFSQWESNGNGTIRLTGEDYFRGESDYLSIDIPYEAFDNPMAWIRVEKQRLMAEQRQRKAKEQAERKQQAIELEQAEREQLARLQAKYGDPK